MRRNITAGFPASLFESQDFVEFNEVTEFLPASWVLQYADLIVRNCSEPLYQSAWKACMEGFRAGAASWEDEDGYSDSLFDVYVDEAITEALEEFIYKNVK
ncbi:TPA: hypothetical protein ACGE0Z_002392 [Klebsiella pneumoniae]